MIKHTSYMTDISSNEIEKLAFDAGNLIMSGIDNDDITEIMLNPNGSLWFEDRIRGMYEAGRMDEHFAENFIYTAAGLSKKTINKQNPYLETELPFDRARFEATISPITDKPSFTIRKRAKVIYTMSDYISSGIITETQAKAIENTIIDKKSILICGAPGTGKTTFANACVDTMTSLCSATERILTLEDVPELQCNADNLLSMYTNKYSGELEKIKEERLYNTNSTVLQDLIKSKSLTEKQASAVINLTGQLNDYKNIHKRYKYLIDSYEEILNNIDQIVYVKDKQHRYKYVNESFLTITETNIYKDDITNISYSRIFENSDYFELLKLENKVFKTGLPIKDSRIIIPNTNGNRIGLVNIIPRFSSNDQTVTEILVTIKDSTQIFYAIEKQEQLIDAINSLDEYVFIRNDTSIQNNKYIFLSDSVKKIYGYTAEEFYEDQNLWYDLILEEDKEKLKIDTDTNYLPEGTSIYRIINKEGKVRWVKNKIFKKKGLDGRDIIFGKVSDITDTYIKQKDREELERAVELSKIVVWVADANLMKSPEDPLPITYISDNIYEHLGIRKEDVLKDPMAWLNAVYENDLPKAKKFRELQEYPKAIDFRILTKNKDMKWVNLKIDKKDNWIYGVIRDFTEAKKSDQTRIELQQAVENSDSLVLVEKLKNIKDKESFEFVYIGSKLEERWGLTRKQLIQKPDIWLDLILPDDKEEVLEAINSNIPTIVLKYRIIDKNTCEPKWLYHKIVRKKHARYSYVATLWYKDFVETYGVGNHLNP